MRLRYGADWRYAAERSNGRWAGEDGRVPLIYSGTPGDDRLLGDRAGDFYDMSQGGDDVVKAGGGNDTISFGATFTGADRVNGGGGYNDFVMLDGDYSTGLHIERQSLVKIEYLQLTGGSYVVTGELGYAYGAETTVYGFLDEDHSLSLDVGSAGDLYVFAGDGDDILHADAHGHASYLSADDGNDVLIGGPGATTFVGGRGADRIEMANAGDIVSEGAHDSSARAYDTIVNFDGSGGRIRLAFDSDTETKGLQSDFRLGATPGRTGDVTFAYDAQANETILSVFTDGDAKADFVLHLAGNVTLTNGDFIFG